MERDIIGLQKIFAAYAAAKNGEITSRQHAKICAQNAGRLSPGESKRHPLADIYDVANLLNGLEALREPLRTAFNFEHQREDKFAARSQWLIDLNFGDKGQKERYDLCKLWRKGQIAITGAQVSVTAFDVCALPASWLVLEDREVAVSAHSANYGLVLCQAAILAAEGCRVPAERRAMILPRPGL